MKASAHRWCMWVGVMAIAAALMHASTPHAHTGATDVARCAIHATGAGNFVSAPAPTASLLPPPAAPEIISAEPSPACATPAAPCSPRAPPSEVLG